MPFATVVSAFVTSRLTPILTDDEFKAVFKAVDAYHNEPLNLVNWRAILSAPVSRETQSYLGVFPRIVSVLYSAIDVQITDFVPVISPHLEKEGSIDARSRSCEA